MMNRLFAGFAAITLIACAPPPVELQGPTETATASREVFFKGLRGGRTAAPFAAERTYTLTCTADGGNVASRANQAIPLITAERGRVMTQLIGAATQKSQERRVMNPILKQQLGCIIGRIDDRRITSTETEAVRYMIENDLLMEVSQKR